MKRGNRPYQNQPGTSLSDRSKQRDAILAKRAEMAARLSAASKQKSENPPAQPPEPRVERDPALYAAAVSAVPLYHIGEGAALPVSDAYRRMMDAAIGVMNSGDVHVLLCWPPQQPSFSALVSLLAIADVEAAEKIDRKQGTTLWKSAAAPLGLRALLYPYARSTHRASRQIQVDRDYLGAVHLRHTTRTTDTGDADAALKDYHAVAGRAKTLTGIARDGETYPEFMHPTLDEMVPHGNCDGSPHPNGKLLWRTHARTDLRQGLKRTEAADDGSKARFYLYGLSENDRVGTVVRKLTTSPDVVIVDLTRAARNRLGRNWVETVRTSCSAIREAHPTSGVLVVTDDPWSFDAARFDVFGTPGRGRKQKATPAPSSTIFMASPSIIGETEDRRDWHGAAHVIAHGFSGELPNVVQDLRAVAAHMRGAGERRGIDPINHIVGKLRRAASLPGSLTEFSAYIAGEVGDHFAADVMTGYRINREIADLQDPLRGIDQIGGEGMRTALKEASGLVRAAEAATPMSSLLEEELDPALRKSYRSVFIFRSQMIAEFALDRFSRLKPRLKGCLESGMVNFTGPAGLTDIAEMTEAKRNQHKRVIYVAPTREGILAVMAQPWLPENVVFLADVATLRFAARDAERLAQQIGHHPVSNRLTKFAVEAAAEVQRRGSHVVLLDVIIPPVEDVDFPAGAVIDLVGGGRGTRDALKITLDSKQTILARRGTGIVVRDGTRTATVFNEVAAKDIAPGDQVCAISAGFIEQARPLLNITATAADMIRDYHEEVTESFQKLPGTSVEDKLRSLVAAMGAPQVQTGRARYWIKLKSEMGKSLDEVVPHAPQDRETFLRFTGALGIAPRVADTFWTWAVIAQRSSRMKAGFAFHDAYKGILTDPHGAIATNSTRETDIRRLRALAEDFVSTVLSVEEYRA